MIFMTALTDVGDKVRGCRRRRGLHHQKPSSSPGRCSRASRAIALRRARLSSEQALRQRRELEVRDDLTQMIVHDLRSPLQCAACASLVRLRTSPARRPSRSIPRARPREAAERPPGGGAAGRQPDWKRQDAPSSGRGRSRAAGRRGESPPHGPQPEDGIRIASSRSTSRPRRRSAATRPGAPCGSRKSTQQRHQARREDTDRRRRGAHAPKLRRAVRTGAGVPLEPIAGSSRSLRLGRRAQGSKLSSGRLGLRVRKLAVWPRRIHRCRRCRAARSIFAFELPRCVIHQTRVPTTAWSRLRNDCVPGRVAG